MVDLYSEFTGTARGWVQPPDPVPSAMESFEKMTEDGGFSLEMAGLGEVYLYLRKGRHLKIPNHWRKHLPKDGKFGTGGDLKSDWIQKYVFMFL